MIKLCKCQKTEFEALWKDKSVICFGAGNEFFHVCASYEGLEKKVIAIVDNYKAGSTCEFKGTIIPIISIDKIPAKREETLYLITTVYYADAFAKQLDKIDILSEEPVIVSHYIEDEIGDDSIIREENNKKKEIIPRIIHYCWFGGGEIPDRFKKNIDSWHRFCPDYEIKKWDEHNYDINKNSYMKQAYEAKRWGFVPDYARLDIVNTYGGVYLDTDVEMLRPWDSLLCYEMFCGFESSDYIALGLGFGATKDNAIIIDMLKQYDSLTFMQNDGRLNLVASPIYQTQVMVKHGLVCNGKLQISDKFAAFPTQYFAPINPFGKGMPTSVSYSIHQYAATWIDDAERRKKERAVQSISYISSRIMGSYKQVNDNVQFND